MNKEYYELTMGIITQAIEDIRSEKPSSDEYQDADQFFKTQWFYDLAKYCSVEVSSITKTVFDIKQERAEGWYLKLDDPHKKDVQKKILEISMTWDATLAEMLVWAWQTENTKQKKRKPQKPT